MERPDQHSETSRPNNEAPSSLSQKRSSERGQVNRTVSNALAGLAVAIALIRAMKMSRRKPSLDESTAQKNELPEQQSTPLLINTVVDEMKVSPTRTSQATDAMLTAIEYRYRSSDGAGKDLILRAYNAAFANRKMVGWEAYEKNGGIALSVPTMGNHS